MKSKVCSEEQTGNPMLQIGGLGVNRSKDSGIAADNTLRANVQIDFVSRGVSVKTNVLLVEDSKVLKITGERLLTRAGFLVTTAQDGEEALKMVRSSPPDVILLDMLLPKLGGQQVLQALKVDPVTAGIPVIILSSLSQKNEAMLIKAGAAAYFEKAKLLEDTNSGKLQQTIEKIVLESRVGKPAKLAAVTTA
jgi:CheY-like chemotaxis protein